MQNMEPMEHSFRLMARDLSPIVVPLLKGVIYRDESMSLWSLLQDKQVAVRDYMAVLGLDLFFDEAEGYAFLGSRMDREEEGHVPVPRLIARRQLSYPVSLLLALFRKKLAEFDAEGGDARLIISREEVLELIQLFLPEGSNEVKLSDQVDTTLNKVVELGFIRRMRGQKGLYEVRRIIKAFVDAQWLADFDAKLLAYRNQVMPSGEVSDE